MNCDYCEKEVVALYYTTLETRWELQFPKDFYAVCEECKKYERLQTSSGSVMTKEELNV